MCFLMPERRHIFHLPQHLLSLLFFCYIYKNYEHIKSVNQKKENLSFTPELTFDAAF